MTAQKNPPFEIVKVSNLDVTKLTIMCDDAASGGFEFVERLCNEWSSGANRFEGRGGGFQRLDDDAHATHELYL